MKPPYTVTPKALKLVADIFTLLGMMQSNKVDRPVIKLRKQNQIKTIHHSLKIEGNTLTERQITALLEGKRVQGPERDIREVLNAIEVYDVIEQWNATSERDYLKAHGVLMAGLVERPGRYRSQAVGIAKGSEIQHLAPPHDRVPGLMKELFGYLKAKGDLALIKACVFHYEMELIHPFLDGNGRMGRLWQTVILREEYPVLAQLPLESVISARQEAYYAALAASDQAGASTPFLEFMLEVIHEALDAFTSAHRRPLTATDRINYFASGQTHSFTRRDYLLTFPELSTATASRDLQLGVHLGLFRRTGANNQSRYEVV